MPDKRKEQISHLLKYRDLIRDLNDPRFEDKLWNIDIEIIAFNMYQNIKPSSSYEYHMRYPGDIFDYQPSYRCKDRNGRN